MQKLLIGLLSVFIITSQAVHAHGEETPWAWLRAELQPDGKSWSIHQGQTRLHVDKNSRFRAELDIDSPTLQQHYQLDGRIRGSRADATEILLNSDAGPGIYDGVAQEGLFSGSSRVGACIHLHTATSVIALCKAAA